MDLILDYLNKTIADEVQLKAHYLQIAHRQQEAGNIFGSIQNTACAVFVQSGIDNLVKVHSMLSKNPEVEEQLWC